MHLLVGVSRHCPHSHRDKSRRDSSFTRTHCNHANYHVSLLMLVCHHVFYRLPTSASHSLHLPLQVLRCEAHASCTSHSTTKTALSLIISPCLATLHWRCLCCGTCSSGMLAPLPPPLPDLRSPP